MKVELKVLYWVVLMATWRGLLMVESLEHWWVENSAEK